MKLSEIWQNGTFKRFRKYLGGRSFCFVKDRQKSETMAHALAATWAALEAQGKASQTA